MKSIEFGGSFEVDDYDFVLMPICLMGKLFATAIAGTEKSKVGFGRFG